MVTNIERGPIEGNPPQRGIQNVVAELWTHALQIDRCLGARDDFFALGGDSLTMVMVELCVQEEFSIELPPGSLLARPALEDFCNLIDGMRQR